MAKKIQISDILRIIDFDAQNISEETNSFFMNHFKPSYLDNINNDENIYSLDDYEEEIAGFNLSDDAKEEIDLLYNLMNKNNGAYIRIINY